MVSGIGRSATTTRLCGIYLLEKGQATGCGDRAGPEEVLDRIERHSYRVGVVERKIRCVSSFAIPTLSENKKNETSEKKEITYERPPARDAR